MDNVLFVPSTREAQWVRDVLPDLSPAELPVAGRRFIDYALECAQKFDVLFTEILDTCFSARLAADFSELTRMGLPVFYMKHEGAPLSGLADLAGLSTPLTQTLSDGLIVVWGLCVLDARPSDVKFEPMPDAELTETPPGVYRREGGRWLRVTPRSFVVDGVPAWHALNFNVLHHPAFFTLPGYSAEKDVHLGRNVVFERGTRVTPPALVQDNVWCSRNVSLGPDVIVGADAFVAEGATLRRTVICDSTFIGLGLELDGKIVVGNRIIDAASGVWTDVEDEGVACLTTAKARSVGLLRRLGRFLLGASRGRRH